MEPSGFHSGRILTPPKVVRFIHDAREEITTPDPSGCQYLGVRVLAFCRVTDQNMPDGTFALLGDYGYEYPDATEFYAKAVPLYRATEGGWGGNEYVREGTILECLTAGHFEIFIRYSEFTWFINGTFPTRTVASEDGPVLTPSCDIAPPGCPCGEELEDA